MNTVTMRWRRKGLVVKQLDMECDRQEIPLSVNSEVEPVGWWLASTIYSGKGCEFRTQDDFGQPTDLTFAGMAAYAVFEDRIIGIMSPDGPEPSIWFSWPLDAISVDTRGEQGLLRKRPTHITVRIDNGNLELSAVSELLYEMKRHRTGQEMGLLKALTR